MPKKANLFDAAKTYEQLTCSGVLEIVKIRKMGYPRRETWETLWALSIEEGYVAQAGIDPATPPAEGMKQLFELALPLGMWQEGRTKVFLKDSALIKLGEWKLSSKVTFILKRYRMWIERKHYRRTRIKIKKIQRVAVHYVMMLKYAHLIKNAIRIQAFTRGLQTRYKLKMSKDATKIQKVYRGVKTRFVVARLFAARKIQANFRGFFSRKQLLEHVCTVMLQASWRGFRTRRTVQRGRAAGTIVWACKRKIAHKKFGAIAKARANAVTVVGGYMRMAAARLRFLRVRRTIRRLQACYKWKVVWRLLRKKKARDRVDRAANVISCFFAKKRLSDKLTEWIQDTIAAITWGDLEETEQLLACTNPIYNLVKPIPDKVNLRDRTSQYKTFMHAAITSDPVNENIVVRLIDERFKIDCVDAGGGTLLHKCAEMGDERLACATILVNRYVQQCHAKSTFTMQKQSSFGEVDGVVLPPPPPLPAVGGNGNIAPREDVLDDGIEYALPSTASTQLAAAVATFMNRVDLSGRTAFDVALENDATATAQFLLEHGAKTGTLPMGADQPCEVLQGLIAAKRKEINRRPLDYRSGKPGALGLSRSALTPGSRRSQQNQRDRSRQRCDPHVQFFMLKTGSEPGHELPASLLATDEASATQGAVGGHKDVPKTKSARKRFEQYRQNVRKIKIRGAHLAEAGLDHEESLNHISLMNALNGNGDEGGDTVTDLVDAEDAEVDAIYVEDRDSEDGSWNGSDTGSSVSSFSMNPFPGAEAIGEIHREASTDSRGQARRSPQAGRERDGGESRPEFHIGKHVHRTSSAGSIGRRKQSAVEPGSPGQTGDLKKHYSFHASEFGRGSQSSTQIAHFANTLRGDGPRDVATSPVKRRGSKGNESGGSGLRARGGGGGGRGGSGLRPRGGRGGSSSPGGKKGVASRGASTAPHQANSPSTSR